MPEVTLLICLCQLLLVRYAALIPQVDADCNGNVTLPCPAVNQENMDFLALAWYKEDSNGKRHGIIRKSDDGVMAFENGRTASFGTMHSLLLNWVNASDEGTYLCAMSANVGGQNKDARVELTVREQTRQARSAMKCTFHKHGVCWALEQWLQSKSFYL
ncbi:uncharacterized protein LOC101172979 isoform X2 [Oryzias latipes]